MRRGDDGGYIGEKGFGQISTPFGARVEMCVNVVIST